MQRIEVKNFGPLKDITLDIKDYMVFIGPQASGKSTLAKLIYFCKKIEIDRYVLLVRFGAIRLTQKQVSIENFALGYSNNVNEIFELYFKGFEFSGTYFKITYNSYSITFKNNRFDVDNSFFDDFNFVNDNIGALISSKNHNPSKVIGDKSIELYLENIINYQNNDSRGVRLNHENIIIPAQRSIANYLNLNEQKVKDIFLIDYLEFTQSLILGLRDIFPDSPYHKYKSLLAILPKQILRGEHAYIEDKRVIYYGEDKYVELPNASSGQQAALWIIEAIIELFATMGVNESYSYRRPTLIDLVIEEPEAHLFPDSQRDMTYFISLFANQSISRTVLTTHSPYILAALNNLIEAYKVGQEESKRRLVGRIVDPLLWVNPERLYVGYLDNGGIESIIDKETNLISHEILDGVSVDIMSQFDDLLEIQYAE